MEAASLPVFRFFFLGCNPEHLQHPSGGGGGVSRRRWSNAERGFRLRKKLMTAPCSPVQDSGCRLGKGVGVCREKAGVVLDLKVTGDTERWEEKDRTARRRKL